VRLLRVGSIFDFMTTSEGEKLERMTSKHQKALVQAFRKLKLDAEMGEEMARALSFVDGRPDDQDVVTEIAMHIDRMAQYTKVLQEAYGNHVAAAQVLSTLPKTT